MPPRVVDSRGHILGSDLSVGLWVGQQMRTQFTTLKCDFVVLFQVLELTYPIEM